MSESGGFSNYHMITSDKQMLSIWNVLHKLNAGNTTANQII